MLFPRFLLLCLAALASGQALVSTRVLSGSGSDRATLVATDKQGFVYVAGSTSSPDFPVSQALQAQLAQTSLRISVDGRVFSTLPLASPIVSAIASSGDGQVLFAATPLGVYRSGDAGATWAIANGGLSSPGVALAVDPTNPQVAYVVLSNGLIYLTRDAGAHWQAAAIKPRGFPDSQIVGAQLAINPQHTSTLYSLTGNCCELFKSTDAGATWQKLSIPDPNGADGQFIVSTFALAPSAPDTLYVAGSGRLHKSTDGGATWTALAIASAGLGGLTVDPRDANVVWLVNNTGVSRSLDGGATFALVGLAGTQFLHTIAVDASDSSKIYAADFQNVYASTDGGATFPRVAGGAVQTIYAGPRGVFLAGQVIGTTFLTKFDSTLSRIVYSTFFGPDDVGFLGINTMAVDDDGNVYLAGSTQSPDFPTTPGALQRNYSGISAGFVSKLSADGSKLLYSTLLNGMQVLGLAIDASGNATVTGTAVVGAVPVTTNAPQSAPPGNCDHPFSVFGPSRSTSTHAFVARLNPDASALVYATYLSGACGDFGYAVAVDAAGAAYVTGETYADDFPVTPGAMLTTPPVAYTSGFVARLSPAGDRIDYATYFGHDFYAAGHAIALDASGAVIVAGNIQQQATPGAFQRPAGPGCPPTFGFGPVQFPPIGPNDAFAMKLNLNAADPVFLATFGGSCQDSVSSLALDSSGNLWMAGTTASTDFATRAPFSGLGDMTSSGAFIAEMRADGTDLLFAKIVGGGAVATGPGSDVYYAGSLLDSSKTTVGPNGQFYSAQIGRIDSSTVAPIAIDQVVSFNQSQGIPPYFMPLSFAPGQMLRLRGRGIGPATQAGARLTADGRLDTLIGGVQVLFDGVPAPMVTAQANEIVCLAPFALDGRTLSTAQVSFNGKTSNQFTFKVAAQSADYIAVANADGSINSLTNPAAIGSTVALYLTGLGPTNPPSLDGAILRDPSIRPRTIPSVSSFGIPQIPAFLGAAPGEVAGITQINLIVGDPGASNNLPVYVGSAFGRIYVAKPN
jgi:uncharacterized protein (TIGR03437 family)